MNLKVLYLILYFAVTGIVECRSHADGERIRLPLDTLVQKEIPFQAFAACETHVAEQVRHCIG